MLSKEYVKSVGNYLFHSDVDKLVYSSVYFGEADSELKGNVADVVKTAIDILPSYCKFNLNFAYTYTLRLQKPVNDAIQADELAAKGEEKPKTGNPAKTTEEKAEEALKAAMEQHGMEQHADGLKHQEEINKEAEDVVIGGLESNGDETPVTVAYKIKNINASLERLQKTLRNVSAVSESLIKGLEKVKSEWSETGYDYGRDLALMDASEFALLGSEQTKKLWLLKYAKGELLQESSQDKKGLGDLIIAVDTSGSTAGAAYHGNLVIDVEMGIALAMSKLAIKNKCKQVALTFNDYNKNIIAIWKRTRLGEKRTPREPRHMFYSNFNEVPFPVTIQYTSQLVIYEKLDEEWAFNWHTIKV
jgi:hypothetical protein